MRHDPHSMQNLTRKELWAAAVCTIALSVDTAEIAFGNLLSTVFSAPPYSASSRDLSWVVASVFVGAVVGAPTFGKAAQHWGTRRCLAVALAALCVTSLLAAAAPSLGWLGAMRLLSGLSLGAIPPLLIAYLTVLAPPRHRGLVILWVSGIAALAPPIALFGVRALMAHPSYATTGWRWALAGAGLVALCAAVLFLGLPEDVKARPPAGVCAESVSSVARRRRFIPLAALYFLLPWASIGFPLLTGPLLLARGYDLSRALLYVAMSAVGPAVAPLIVGLFVDRLSRRVALAACTASMLGAAALFVFGTSAAMLMTALLVFGIAAALYLALLTLYAAEIFPTSIRTTATSIAWAINRGAAVIAPIVLLSLVGRSGSITPLWPVGVALLLSLVFVFLSKHAGSAGRAVD